MRRLLLALVFLAPSVSAQWAENRPPDGGPHSRPAVIFPTDNWQNQNISAAPVDPNSDAIISAYSVGATGTRLQYLWGNSTTGIPFATVSSDYPCVYFTQVVYASESDMSVCYPIPAEAHSETGWTEQISTTIDDSTWTGDRHMHIYDPARGYLYEIYQIYHNHTASPVVKSSLTVGPDEYYASSVTFWNLNTNNTRPKDFTSSTAAGTSQSAGLVDYDKFLAGTINHAMGFTLPLTNSKWYTFPATHKTTACSLPFPGLCPALGTRLRLKASYDPAVQSPAAGTHCIALLNALKTYGMYLEDNGGSYLNGTNDDRWGTSASTIRVESFNCLNVNMWLSNFEVIQYQWGESLEHQVTPGDTYVHYRFGAFGLPYGQSCTVTLQDSGGSTITTNTLSTGPAKRETSFTGLSPSTSYKIVSDCGGYIPEAGVAFPADSFTTTAATASGSRTVPINVKPAALLSTAARVTIDYGTTSAVSDGSVQNTSCSNAGGGCTVNLSLAKGVQWYRTRWQTSGDAVIATSVAQSIVVK